LAHLRSGQLKELELENSRLRTAVQGLALSPPSRGRWLHPWLRGLDRRHLAIGFVGHPRARPDRREPWL